jgi:hypothetical protein
MTPTPNRRTVVGWALTAGACLSAPSWAEAGPAVADPILAAIERHREAYDAFMDVWSKTDMLTLYDRAKADESAVAELRRFREIEIEEEAAFSSLLATRPPTKGSAIACVLHVADCGLATDEMRAWLAMLMESPLVA